MQPKVSVIVATHSGRIAALRDFSVKSLLDSDYPADRLEIIIVDNNRDRRCLRRMHSLFGLIPNVRILRTGRRGCSFARNAGINAAFGDILAFIDDDCEVDHGWVKRMVRFYENPEIQFGGGAVYDTALGYHLRERESLEQWPPERRIIFGNMSMRRQVALRNRPDNHLVYGKEEFELAGRLLAQDLEAYFDERPILHHRAASEYRRTEGSDLTDLGEKEVRFAEEYLAAKAQIFRRHLACFRGSRHYWMMEIRRLVETPQPGLRASLRALAATLKRLSREYSLWSRYALRVLLVPFSARVQVCRDLRRLNAGKRDTDKERVIRLSANAA